jgi:hypothetical protein
MDNPTGIPSQGPSAALAEAGNGGARASAPAAASPPTTNRGATVANGETTGLTIGLHWITLTAFTNPANLGSHVVNYLLGETLSDPMKWVEVFLDSGASGRRYKSIRIGPHGIKLYSAPVHGLHCSLEIPGEAIEALGHTAIFEFLSELDALTHKDIEGRARPVSWRCTRLDIALDHAPFQPRDCYEAWRRRDVRCAANWDRHKWEENPQGQLVRCGARSSMRYLRIYNRRGYTRVELELKGLFADAAVHRYFQETSEEWKTTAVGMLRDYIDFVDRNTGGSSTRAELLPWWQAFVGDIPRAKERPRRADPAGELLQRRKAYLTRLLPTLCVLRIGLSISLDELCDMVKDGLGDKHLRELAELRRAMGAACS